MTTNTKNSAEITKLIEAQENELKDLFSRVIKSPLKPLETQITQLEKRLESVEAISKEISEVSLPAVQAAIRAQGEDAQKNFKGLRKAIPEELPELLTACLASMPQEMARLLAGQTSVQELLSEVQQEQTILGKTAAVATDNVISSIGESRGHLDKNLEGAKADARDGERQLGEALNALTDDLQRTIAQVTNLVFAMVGRTEELNSRIENGFAAFQQQAQLGQVGAAKAMQGMGKRFLWLSGLCCLGFAATIGLVASRLL